MQYIGIDIIEISRIQNAVDDWDDKFLRRVYTEREIELFQSKISSLAVRFAAKEAVMKALNAADLSMGFRNIEVLAEPDGKPFIRLYGMADLQAQKLGIHEFAVSLSHSRENAVAVVIGQPA